MISWPQRLLELSASHHRSIQFVSINPLEKNAIKQKGPEYEKEVISKDQDWRYEITDKEKYTRHSRAKYKETDTRSNMSPLTQLYSYPQTDCHHHRHPPRQTDTSRSWAARSAAGSKAAAAVSGAPKTRAWTPAGAAGCLSGTR